MMPANEKEYQAAWEGTAFYLQKKGGWLTLSGPDRIDFLHRQSTQDLRSISPEHAALTVLTSPTARILDVLWVVSSEDRLSLLTLPGRGGKTATFLKSKIFFMDKVTVSDESSQFAQIDFIGPCAGDMLRALSVTPPAGEGVVIQSDVIGIPVKVLGLGEWRSLPTYRLCVPALMQDSIIELLQDNHARQIGENIYNILRIEAGIPGEARELTEDYTPLEIGLRHAISDTKGCYTGQEVIARQVSYDKVVRNLVGIQLSNEVDPGTSLHSDGHRVGEVTSAGVSPQFGNIGLAIVRRSHSEAGTLLESGDSRNALATITSLPFME